MATITAAMVKDLRESTGAGMMDCKAALTETAATWKRRRTGSARRACPRPPEVGPRRAEGLIGALTKATRASWSRSTPETDFVARNGQFQGLVKMIAQVAFDVGADVEKIKAAKVGDVTVEAAINDANRHHRREHVAAPRSCPRSEPGRGVELTSTARSSKAPARWA